MLNALIAAGIILCAIQAIRVKKLIAEALWRAGCSGLTALLLYLLGAPEIAVIELSVGAGLVTVLFVFAINIIGDEAPVRMPAIPPGNLARPGHQALESSSSQMPAQDNKIISAIFISSVIRTGAGKLSCRNALPKLPTLTKFLLRRKKSSSFKRRENEISRPSSAGARSRRIASLTAIIGKTYFMIKADIG